MSVSISFIKCNPIACSVIEEKLSPGLLDWPAPQRCVYSCFHLTFPLNQNYSHEVYMRFDYFPDMSDKLNFKICKILDFCFSEQMSFSRPLFSYHHSEHSQKTNHHLTPLHGLRHSGLLTNNEAQRALPHKPTQPQSRTHPFH